jgi:hypothetical protein
LLLPVVEAPLSLPPPNMDTNAVARMKGQHSFTHSAVQPQWYHPRAVPLLRVCRHRLTDSTAQQQQQHGSNAASRRSTLLTAGGAGVLIAGGLVAAGAAAAAAAGVFGGGETPQALVRAGMQKFRKVGSRECVCS